jgi:hypothetical protein
VAIFLVLLKKEVAKAVAPLLLLLLLPRSFYWEGVKVELVKMHGTREKCFTSAAAATAVAAAAEFTLVRFPFQ